MTIDKAQLRALAWHTEDYLTDRSATTYSAAMAARWLSKGWSVNPLFDDKQVDHLFAEIEQLRAELAGLRTGYDAQNNVIVGLKAENEALHKDSERLNWLTAQGAIEDPSQGDVRGYIDAAMAKEASQ